MFAYANSANDAPHDPIPSEDCVPVLVQRAIEWTAGTPSSTDAGCRLFG